MDRFLPRLSSCSAERQFPRHGLSRKSRRRHRGHYSGPCVRIFMGPAKDDHDPGHRRQAARQPNHDAVDDAAADSGVFLQFPHWLGDVLDCFKCSGRWDTVLHNRVAAAVPAISETGRCHRATS